MQDEINEKVVALSVKGAKLTAEMLQKAIKAMLAQAKKQHRNAAPLSRLFQGAGRGRSDRSL